MIIYFDLLTLELDLHRQYSVSFSLTSFNLTNHYYHSYLKKATIYSHVHIRSFQVILYDQYVIIVISLHPSPSIFSIHPQA